MRRLDGGRIVDRVCSACVDLGDALEHLGRLRTFTPVRWPIDGRSTYGRDRLEDVFGRIGVRWHRRAVAGKVRRDVGGRSAGGASVDGLAARCEENDIVEELEKLARRLMDRAQDGQARRRDFAEEAADLERGLRVETTGRFVEEEKEIGVGC